MEHPAELGVRVSRQRAGDSGGGRRAVPVLRRAAQPHYRRCRIVPEFHLGHQQRPASAEREAVTQKRTTLADFLHRRSRQAVSCVHVARCAEKPPFGEAHWIESLPHQQARVGVSDPRAGRVLFTRGCDHRRR